MEVTLTTIKGNVVTTANAEGNIIECAELVKAAFGIQEHESSAEQFDADTASELEADEAAAAHCYDCASSKPIEEAHGQDANGVEKDPALQKELEEILYPKHAKEEIEVTAEEDAAWEELTEYFKKKGATAKDIEHIKTLAAEKDLSAAQVKEALHG